MHNNKRYLSNKTRVIASSHSNLKRLVNRRERAYYFVRRLPCETWGMDSGCIIDEGELAIPRARRFVDESINRSEINGGNRWRARLTERYRKNVTAADQRSRDGATPPCCRSSEKLGAERAMLNSL